MKSQELLDYLETMISPPGGQVLVLDDVCAVDWESYQEQSVHGLVIRSQSSSEWEDEELLESIWRVLKPGAHIMLMAPDDNPTNYRGVCALEDKGFEVRDAFAVLDTPGEFHYVAKTSRKERNAGVPEIEIEYTVERYFPIERADLESLLEELQEDYPELTEGSLMEDGVDPFDLPEHLQDSFMKAKVTAVRKVQNNHPTVKPTAIMEHLMEDLPEGASVIDPFLGSGTTGIAALKRKVNFTGIELEKDHLRIAHHRVHHHDSSVASWDAAEIESEYEEQEDDSKKSLMDLFGI